MTLKMWLVIAIALACLIYLFVLTFVYDPFTAAAQTPTGDNCAQDATANNVVDTGDLALFTGAFGQATPTYLDIIPELAPNGAIDTADIAAVTAHFGETCYGFTGSEEAGAASMSELAFVSGCQFLASGWWYNTSGNLAGIMPWGGRSNCSTSGGGSYASECTFQFEAWDGLWWVPVASTQGYPPSAGTLCAADGVGVVYVPMYTALREKVCHTVYRNGVAVHGFHCHQKPSAFYIPCNPSGGC